MKYYIIAGERSGDLHASNLLLALKDKDDNAQFRGMGGEYMEDAGCTLFAHYKEMALMGFVEVLMHFRRVFKRRQTRYGCFLARCFDFGGFCRFQYENGHFCYSKRY